MDTKNLLVIPCSIEYNSLLIEGKDPFEKKFGIKVADGYMEFPGAMQYSLQLLKEGHPEEWGSYMIIYKKENTLIGIAGYKGTPVNGSVEIGYSIAPAFRRKGFATEAAKALIERAFEYENVSKVTAHTLPEFNESNSVLKKCGMKKTDEVYSEEDGNIWKWEVEKKDYRI